MLRTKLRICICVIVLVLLAVLLYQPPPYSPYAHQEALDFDVESFYQDSDVQQVQGRDLKFYDGEPRKRKPKESHSSGYTFKPLPPYVVNSVGRFLFFIGYARSGHSIVASMLDAHPNMVVAHEYSVFSKWDHSHQNKTHLFNALYNNSQYHLYEGWRSVGMSKKGYSLAMTGLHQGSYRDTISVIGDKSGGQTAKQYRINRKGFIQVYRELKSTVNIPIIAIHVVRNPYDNIATMLLYNLHQKYKVDRSNLLDEPEQLEEQIKSYFSQVQGVVEMSSDTALGPLNVVVLHNSELISEPKLVMRRLCLQLHIHCSEDYIHQCSKKMYASESKSRHLVKWNATLIDLVAQNIQNFDFLQQYSFES